MFETLCRHKRGFPGGSDGKESACDAGDRVQSLGREDPLEEEVATHSSILAWEIPWTEEPGGLQSMGCKKSDTTDTTEPSTGRFQAIASKRRDCN